MTPGAAAAAGPPPGRAAGARRSGGNRLWRLETPAGPVLQKYYRAKAGGLRDAWRGGMSLLLRGATGATAGDRWRTEGEMLALWRAAGVDVPRDLTAEHPGLAGERVRILEWIEGRPLPAVLAGRGLGREARDELLRRAGAAWGGRLAMAASRGDARLVQFHAGPAHLLVAGERMVTVDLEQAYLPGRPVAPALAREVTAFLRGLARGASGEGLRRDLEALAGGVPEVGLLRLALEEARRPGGAVRRVLGALDRNRDRKRRVLALLGEILGRA